MASGPVLRSLSNRAAPAPDIPIQSCSHLVYQCVRIWTKMRSHREPRVAPTTSISLRLSAPWRPIYVVLGKKREKSSKKNSQPISKVISWKTQIQRFRTFVVIKEKNQVGRLKLLQASSRTLKSQQILVKNLF